jgi:hypothetical protein
MTIQPNNPATAAFMLARDKILAAIMNLAGWGACLALTICLAECVVHTTTENDERARRLAQVINVLGDVTLSLMGDDREWEDSGPPAPDLLRKLLEQRKGKP